MARPALDLVLLQDLSSRARKGSGLEKPRILDRLAELMNTDGRTLFEYHASAACSANSKYWAAGQHRLAHLWHSLPPQEQAQWRAWTFEALDAVRNNNPANMLIAGPTSNRCRDRAVQIVRDASVDARGYLVAGGVESGSAEESGDTDRATGMEEKVPTLIRIFDLKSQASQSKSKDDRRLICDQISDLLTTNGRVLFEYHIYTTQFGSPAEHYTEQFCLAKLWDSLPSEEQMQWRLFTKQASHDLEDLRVNMFTKGPRSQECRDRAIEVARGCSLGGDGCFVANGTSSHFTLNVGLPTSYAGVVARKTTTGTMEGPRKRLSTKVLKIQNIREAAAANGLEKLNLSHYSQLLLHITVNGRALFEYHACLNSRMLRDADSSFRGQSWKLAKLWDSLPEDKTNFWRDRSWNVHNGLRDCQPSVLNNLDTNSTSDRMLVYREVVDAICSEALLDESGYFIFNNNPDDLALEEDLVPDPEYERDLLYTQEQHQITAAASTSGTSLLPEHELAAEILTLPAVRTDIAGIRDLIHGFAVEEDEDDKAFIMSGLRDKVDSDGRTLFEYHALSLLASAMCSDEELEEYAPQLVHLWDRQSKHMMAFWSKQSQQFLDGSVDGKNNGDMLVYFKLGSFARRSLEYTEKVSISLLAVAESGEYGPVQLVLEMLARLHITFPPLYEAPSGLPDKRGTPILDIVHGSPIDQGLLIVAIPSILDRIRLVVSYKVDLQLTGRIGRARIDFDPSATGVTGIAARLRQACSRSITVDINLDDQEPRERLQWLVRPLVYWNRHHKAFNFINRARNEDLPLIPEEEQNSYHEHNESCLNWMGSNLAELRPFTADEKHDVVEAILIDLRGYVSELAKLSKTTTLHAAMVYQSIQRPGIAQWWSLHGKTGFGKFLLDCFNREHLSSHEYEDLLEQRFFALREFVVNGESGEDPLKFDEKPMVTQSIELSQ